MRGALMLLMSLTLVTAAVYLTTSRSIGAQQPAASAGAVGRYQIVLNPQIRSDRFLLDTTTGRIWAPGVYTDYEDDPRVWELETRVDNAQQLQAFLATKTRKK